MDALGPTVSIIVPVLDDTAELDALLAELAPEPDVEIIVVNGRSHDAAMTELQARRPRVRWMESGPGRGRQMNRGAADARGRWLLFLHADCRLPPTWRQVLARADQDDQTVGGSFRFTLDSSRWVARVIERGVRWRVRWLGLAYGDQAIFTRRATFDALQGYSEIPLLEDLDLVRRLRAVGRVLHSRLPVRVSARRWEQDGWLRRSGENILLLVLYVLGATPERLARIYHRGRRAGPT